MATLVSTMAVFVVAIFFLFILKCLVGFALRRRNAALPLHEDLADVTEDIAGASKVAATLASVAAFFAAPAGLLTIASAFGLASKPFIVVLLPALIVFAAGAMTLSILAKLYAKSVRKRHESRRD